MEYFHLPCSLFLGAVAGSFFGNMIALALPGLEINPTIFVMAGIAAMVSAATSAPLTAIIIVYEMTQDYRSTLSVVAAVSVAYAVRRHFSVADIYTLKLNRRGQFIPEGLTTDLKSHILIDDIMDCDIEFLDEDQSISGNTGIVCVVRNGIVGGIIDLRSTGLKHRIAVGDLDHRDFIVLSKNMTVSDAVRKLKDSHHGVALVSMSGGADQASIVGVLTAIQIVRTVGNTAQLLR